MGEFQYAYFDISFSRPAHRKALFEKVEFVDVYTWYVSLSGRRTKYGEHHIAIRTQEPEALTDLLATLDATYGFTTRSYPITAELDCTKQMFDQKYTDKREP